MYLPIPAFPDLAENIAESFKPKVGENPMNEEHDRKVGNDEIVLDNNVQVQIMRHNSSFLRGDNSWKDFHESNQEVIYIEGAD